MSDLTAWVPQHSIRLAATLMAIASGVSLLTASVLAFWGARPGTFMAVAAGLQILVAMGLRSWGGRVAIPALSVLAAIALWPAIRGTLVRGASGMEFPVGISVMLAGMVRLFVFWYLLPYALLLIGEPSRRKHAIALATFVSYELISTATLVTAELVKQRGLS